VRRTGATQKFEAAAHAVRSRVIRGPPDAKGSPAGSGGDLGEFPGIGRTREGSPLRLSTPERYRDRPLPPSLCTGYINIMLSRFPVKRAPPGETVTSAKRGTGHRRRRRPCRTRERWEIKEQSSPLRGARGRGSNRYRDTSMTHGLSARENLGVTSGIG